jgi:hypothetical protein
MHVLWRALCNEKQNSSEHFHAGLWENILRHKQIKVSFDLLSSLIIPDYYLCVGARSPADNGQASFIISSYAAKAAGHTSSKQTNNFLLCQTEKLKMMFARLAFVVGSARFRRFLSGNQAQIVSEFN